MGNKVLPLVFCFCVLLFSTVESLKIAAYNVRTFGQSKLKNTVAMNMITQIVREYDVILIQEVRGVNPPDQVANALLDWVGTDQYSVCNSAYNFKPSKNQRELYLYLYRHDKVKCLGTVEAETLAANPPFQTRFRRPPTIAKFQSHDKDGKSTTDFFVIGIHTQPTNAVNEINSLVDVYNSFLNTPGNGNFKYGFVMGDYNYGGSYVNDNLQDKLEVDTHLHRVIDRDAQTSVLTLKPYDRIYVGPKSGNSIVKGHGVNTFRDDLSPKDYYRSVSDHYPVFVEVDIGDSGGVIPKPKPFPTPADALNEAQKEECNAVNDDFHNGSLEEDEQQFLNFCNHPQTALKDDSSELK